MPFTTELALPMASMMLLTLAVWVVMLMKRIPFMQANNIDVEQMKSPADVQALIPGAASAPANNLRNMTELPVVFYVVALYLTVFGQVDGVHVTCAWIFVGFRVLHSIIHCTYNSVMHRFLAYLVSSLTLWVMVVRAFLGAI